MRTLLLVIVLGTPISAWSAHAGRMITAEGTGVVRVVPDIAWVTLSMRWERYNPLQEVNNMDRTKRLLNSRSSAAVAAYPKHLRQLAPVVEHLRGILGEGKELHVDSQIGVNLRHSVTADRDESVRIQAVSSIETTLSTRLEGTDDMVLNLARIYETPGSFMGNVHFQAHELQISETRVAGLRETAYRLAREKAAEAAAKRLKNGEQLGEAMPRRDSVEWEGPKMTRTVFPRRGTLAFIKRRIESEARLTAEFIFRVLRTPEVTKEPS